MEEKNRLVQVKQKVYLSNRNNFDTNKGLNGYKDLNLTSGTVKTTYTDAIDIKIKINELFIKETLNKILGNNVVFKFIQ